VRLAAALALAFLVAAPAFAANPVVPDDPVQARYTPAFDKCLASPDGQSTMGMIECTQQEADLQDARLNAAYKKAGAGLNARQKAKLLAAQRAWIVFRDAECASYQDEDWGTVSRVLAAGCVLHMTVQRTMDLERYPPNASE
jgi:uncharacterized protein YecT (DUF1311 family)